MIYNSPPTTVGEQLKLIRSRGMLIPDEAGAAAFLKNVGYYRFTGYALHLERFEKWRRTHTFKKDSSFETVRGLYDFDSGLRSLLFEVIGDIEIAFRTQLCTIMSVRTKDSHWPLDYSLFVPQFDHNPHILQSWIHSLTVLRNLCAHHARIWNAALTIKPEPTRQMERAYSEGTLQRERIVLLLDITGELLKPLGKYERFIDRVNTLLQNHPEVPLSPMGLRVRQIEYEKGFRDNPL